MRVENSDRDAFRAAKQVVSLLTRVGHFVEKYELDREGLRQVAQQNVDRARNKLERAEAEHQSAIDAVRMLDKLWK